MRTSKLMMAIAVGSLIAHTALADILFVDIGGVVTVNGTPTAGVTVEALPCPGARLPSDWPTPPPNTVSGLPDPAMMNHNYQLTFVTLFADGGTPGPAGSFTFLAINGAWFTAVDVQL